MPKGYSLHVGLNNADPAHYPGMPVLKAAVNDAKFWKKFAGLEGYISKSLHDEEATAEAVKKQLADYAKKMEAGDILMLTYAGHGGDMPNEKPAGLDKENYDQTWCLYDRQLLDDELYECFEAFKEGTRIVIVSDSCHSGTIAKADEINLSDLLVQGMTRSAKARGFASRKLPKKTKDTVLYKFGSTVYKPLLSKYKNKRKAEGVKASVKLLAACQDDEETLDGENNGIFTEAFIEILKDPDFKNADAETLIDEVKERYFFPQPNFFQYGSIIPSFDDNLPFKIDIPDADKISGYRKPNVSSAKAKPTRVAKPSDDEMIERKPAVLIIEVEGEINSNVLEGDEVKILEKKQAGGRQIFTVELKNIPNEQAWSAAHSLQTEIKERGYNVVVEPVLTVTPAQRARLTREGDIDNPDYIREWPPSLQQGKIFIGWHLDDEHSQLAKA
ncbi:MAG: caspase family protein, partial [Chitinophagaceae bacterium]